MPIFFWIWYSKIPCIFMFMPDVYSKVIIGFVHIWRHPKNKEIEIWNLEGAILVRKKSINFDQ